MPVCLAGASFSSLKTKLAHLLAATRTGKSFQKLEAGSILGGSDGEPFWNELTAVLSGLLWLPTLTDLQGSCSLGNSGCEALAARMDSSLSNVCAIDGTVNSWFSSKKITAPKSNSLAIYCPSSTAVAVGFAGCATTRETSVKSYKKSRRHSHSKTSKPNPNAVDKIRIYPESALHKLWKQWVAGARYAYNEAIALLKKGAKPNGYQLRKVVLSNPNLPEWVKKVPRKVKANAVLDAADAWKLALANGGEAKFRSCRQPLHTIKFDAESYRKGQWMPDIAKGLTCQPSAPLPDICAFGTALSYDRRQKHWYALIPRVDALSQTEQTGVIALDPGVRTFLTGFDGESVLEFGRGDIGRIARLCLHLDKLDSKMHSKTVKARQRRRMKDAAARLRSRIRTLVDDAHKKIASYLTRTYKVIFLPAFATSQMVVKVSRKIASKTARQMLSWSHYRFKTVLKALAAKRGVLVVETNEAYTSKTCTNCGNVHRKLGGSKIFKCPHCGFEIDRDWAGARNNMLRALGATPFTAVRLPDGRDAIVTFQSTLELSGIVEKGQA